MAEKHYNNELFTFFLYLTVWLFVVSWIFFIFDVLFYWYNPDLTLSQCVFKCFLHGRLPFQLPLILCVGTHIKSNLWQQLFSWRIWLFPISLVISISILIWQFNPTYLYQTALLGFKWNWVAVIEWNILFFLQLYLYQKCHAKNFVGFALSYLGVFLGSFLYEIPFFIKMGGIYNRTFLITYLVSFTVFVGVLCREKIKLKLYNFILFFPIILLWIFYFNTPMWIHRLSVFPFFLIIPFGFRRR